MNRDVGKERNLSDGVNQICEVWQGLEVQPVCEVQEALIEQPKYKKKRMRKGQRGTVRGSFTVEAVFIVPMVTMIIILLIDMALYLRDVSVAETLAERVAEDTRALILNDEEPRQHKVMYERKLTKSIFRRWFTDTSSEDAESMEEYLTELSEGRFWISRIDSQSIRAEGGTITVHIRLCSDTEIPLFGKTLTSRWFSDDVESSVSFSDVVLRTRVYSAIMETGMNIVGVSTVMEKLSEIVNRFR